MEEDDGPVYAKGLENAVCRESEIIPYIDVRVGLLGSARKGGGSFRGSSSSVLSGVYGGRLNNAVVNKIFKVNVGFVSVTVVAVQRAYVFGLFVKDLIDFLL